MIRIRLLSIALLAGCTGVAHGEDLLQIYQLARNSDPTLAGAQANKLATDESVTQARAQLLPQIGINLNFSRARSGDDGDLEVLVDPLDPAQGYMTVDGVRRTVHTRSTSATLNQSILDISKWTALKASRYSAQAGAASYDAAQQQLLISTAQAYFNVLTALDALKFADANEKALARQLEQAQQRFDVGLAAITDVNDAKAQHDQAVATVINNRNAVDTAREAVRQLTNQEPGEFKHLREDIPLTHPTPDDPAAWVEVALKQNPSLQAASLNVDVANANIASARAGHLPTLDGSLTYGRTSSWNDVRYGGLPSSHGYAGEPRWGSTVMLSLNVPIFSGGYTQSRVRQSIHQRDYAQDQFELGRRQIEAATRNNFRSVIAGASAVEATRAAVVSAQSSVEATQAGYEVGTRTIVDVLISQQTLLQAQSQYSAARHAFVMNGLLLKQAAGVIEVKDLEAINALLE